MRRAVLYPPPMTRHDPHREKRLIYRAMHRGFKEADFVIGGFAREQLSRLAPEELDRFEALLELNDHDIYAWVMGVKPPPQDIDSGLIQKMADYAFSVHKTTGHE